MEIKVRGLPYTQVFKSVLSETPAHGSYLSFSPSAHHTDLSDISLCHSILLPAFTSRVWILDLSGSDNLCPACLCRFRPKNRWHLLSTSYHPSLMGSSSHSCTLNYCSFVHSKRFRYNLCRKHWVACWEHEDEEHWIPLSLTSISLYSTEGEGVGMANTWRDDHRTLGFAGSTYCFHNFKESLPLPMEEGHLYFQKLLPAVLWPMIRGDTGSVGLPGQWGGWKTVAGESWWGIQQREVQQGQSGNNGGRSMKKVVWRAHSAWWLASRGEKTQKELLLVMGSVAAQAWAWDTGGELNHMQSTEPSANADINQLIGIYWKEKEIITTELQFNSSQAHCSDWLNLWDARHCHRQWGGESYPGIKIPTDWKLQTFVKAKTKRHACA